MTKKLHKSHVASHIFSNMTTFSCFAIILVQLADNRECWFSVLYQISLIHNFLWVLTDCIITRSFDYWLWLEFPLIGDLLINGKIDKLGRCNQYNFCSELFCKKFKFANILKMWFSYFPASSIHEFFLHSFSIPTNKSLTLLSRFQD